MILSRKIRRFVSILNPEPGPDRRSKRHHGGSPRVDQFASVDEIVVSVREHHESFFRQNARGFEQPLIVREQSLLVADHFEFHPVRQTDLAGQPRRANGFVRGVTSRRVWQDKDF